MNRKGFTLVELLAVVVILGILSTAAIVSYNKYIDKAKTEKYKQNETTIVVAAKLYLESNPEKKPKNIGDSIKLDLKTLKEANYLKEEISNSKNESCMTNSYVYVYKNSYNKYTYKGELYCGNEQPGTSTEVPSPKVTDFIFTNKEDLKKASFSMTIHGSEDDTIAIDSYNYSISVSDNSNTEFYEVYNSGSLPGQNQKIIVINNKLSDYIKPTNYTNIKVTVTIRNTLGGLFEISKTSDYEDTNPPVCGTITNEPQENEWYNKNDIFNDKKVRQITVGCIDTNGSGCIRNSFSKTWPTKDNKSVKDSDIIIKDNRGLESSCKVRVNVDIVDPNVTVTAYNNKNQKVAQKTSDNTNDITIAANDYEGNDNGWLNVNDYKEGIKYSVSISDDIGLSKYEWETENNNSASGTFKNTKSEQINIYLKGEGSLKGILKVYDIAGNITTFTISANIKKSEITNPEWDCVYAGTVVEKVPIWCNCTLHGEIRCHTRALRHYCYEKKSGTIVDCFENKSKCPKGEQYRYVCAENPNINYWGRVEGGKIIRERPIIQNRYYNYNHIFNINN